MSIFIPPFLLRLINPIVILLVNMFIWISKINFGSLYFKVPNILEIIIYYLLIFTIFEKSNYKFIKITLKKVLAFFIIISILFNFYNFIKDTNRLKIYFIDVGQGDSTLIISPKGKKILIDGGGNEEYDIGKNVLIPYLLSKKINKIDYIIISHFDTDHVDGLLTVMKELRAEKVIISRQAKNCENYEKFINIVSKKNIDVTIVEKGSRIKIEKNLDIDVLWPNSNNIISENILNNNSIVCKLKYNNFSMLFTGDIEEIAEKQILKESLKTNDLNVDILKVGHHGSNTSSTQRFIEKVNPKIALIGVGENNKFGHPNQEVINRLETIGAKIYRTDLMGEIVVIVDNKGKIIMNKK